MSYWDIALYVGVFVLTFMFLYNLWNLIRSGANAGLSFAQSLATAFSNTLAQIESNLSSLATSGNPLSILSWIPTLFGYLLDFISTTGPIGLATYILYGIISFFNGTGYVQSGNGSSTTGTGSAPSSSSPSNNLNPGQGFSITQG